MAVMRRTNIELTRTCIATSTCCESAERTAAGSEDFREELQLLAEAQQILEGTLKEIEETVQYIRRSVGLE